MEIGLIFWVITKPSNELGYFNKGDYFSQGSGEQENRVRSVSLTQMYDIFTYKTGPIQLGSIAV